MALMRILARFPSFERGDPFGSAASPARAAVHADPQEHAVPGEAAVVTADDGGLTSQGLRRPFAQRLMRAISPPRRGMRRVRAGWGSIGFLAVIAAGVWTLAWWRDHQEAVRQQDQPARQVAAAPLESPTQFTR